MNMNQSLEELISCRTGKETAMDLSKYDGKYVRIVDRWGETFTGLAEYGNYDFLECEYDYC